MSFVDWEEYNRWMRQALHTLRLIDADIEYGGYSWACFKAQQAAEYALKAILRCLGRPAFGHELRSLCLEVREICGDVPKDVWRCVLMLDKMYIPTRYPDAFSSGSPFEYYNREEAEEAKSCAEKVISWIELCVLEGLEKVLRERKELQEEIIATARKFVEDLRRVLGKVTVILYGSYVRGDFNLWSDVDLIVISDAFRNIPPLRRYDIVMEFTPPKFELKLWTVEEACVQLSKPWWREALKYRIVLADDYGLVQQLFQS